MPVFVALPGTTSGAQLAGSLKSSPTTVGGDHVAFWAKTGRGTLLKTVIAIAMRAALFAPRDRGRRNQLEQGLSNSITSTAERSARYSIRDFRRKQTRIEENVQPIRKLLQSRQISGSVSNSTPLFGRIRFAARRLCSTRSEGREISRTARGDVSIVQLRRSSLNGILPATKGHTLFSIAPRNSRLSGRCIRVQQSCCQNTLQKSAIQRLHVEKCGVQNKRLAVYPWPAANKSSTELSAINWNKERKQFDREHFTIAQIEVLRISRRDQIVPPMATSPQFHLLQEALLAGQVRRKC